MTKLYIIPSIFYFFHTWCIWHVCNLKLPLKYLRLTEFTKIHIYSLVTFKSINWNVNIQWTIFCTKIIHEKHEQLEQLLLLLCKSFLLCSVLFSSTSEVDNVVSLFLCYGEISNTCGPLFFFTNVDKVMTLFLLPVVRFGKCFQNSMGSLLVIRLPAGPAGLCRCQSPQEECLERETTGSEITVCSLSCKRKNSQQGAGRLLSHINNVCRFWYNWRYYLLTFVNLLKNAENIMLSSISLFYLVLRRDW